MMVSCWVMVPSLRLVSSYLRGKLVWLSKTKQIFVSWWVSVCHVCLLIWLYAIETNESIPWSILLVQLHLEFSIPTFTVLTLKCYLQNAVSERCLWSLCAVTEQCGEDDVEREVQSWDTACVAAPSSGDSELWPVKWIGEESSLLKQHHFSVWMNVTGNTWLYEISPDESTNTRCTWWAGLCPVSVATGQPYDLRSDSRDDKWKELDELKENPETEGCWRTKADR